VFGILWRIRFEHHAACIHGRPISDDSIDPRTLGPLTRVELAEAFRFVRRAQRSLWHDHRLMSR
jgi:signal-transduction protein with cAMP-binding, CBS, and nucleotidyltransferase domain